MIPVPVLAKRRLKRPSNFTVPSEFNQICPYKRVAIELEQYTPILPDAIANMTSSKFEDLHKCRVDLLDHMQDIRDENQGFMSKTMADFDCDSIKNLLDLGLPLPPHTPLTDSENMYRKLESQVLGTLRQQQARAYEDLFQMRSVVTK